MLCPALTAVLPIKSMPSDVAGTLTNLIDSIRARFIARAKSASEKEMEFPAIPALAIPELAAMISTAGDIAFEIALFSVDGVFSLLLGGVDVGSFGVVAEIFTAESAPNIGSAVAAHKIQTAMQKTIAF